MNYSIHNRFLMVPGFLLVLCLCVHSGAMAQQKPAYTVKKPVVDSGKVKDQYLEMRGNVRQSKGSEKEEAQILDSALVTIYIGEIPYSEIWTTKKGKCSFKLPLDKTCKIEVSKNGYVTKFFEVSTKVPNDKKGVFVFSFDIDIFEEVKGLDVNVLKKPIAKVAYNFTDENFAYDIGYTSRINFELKKMYKNYYMLQAVDRDSILNPTSKPPGK